MDIFYVFVLAVVGHVHAVLAHDGPVHGHGGVDVGEDVLGDKTI